MSAYSVKRENPNCVTSNFSVITSTTTQKESRLLLITFKFSLGSDFK